MKKIISVILCALMLVSATVLFSACEQGEQGVPGADGKDGVDGKDGADGKDGKDGKDGIDGKDGVTPEITISEDGYWVINGQKTNVKAEAANAENPQQLDFYPKDDGSYAVGVGNAKHLSTIIIPETYNGAPVTELTSKAFENCTSLKSITIPDSVTSIGSSAFRYCTSLAHVSIGNSVTSIGKYAFYDCTSLTSVTIPDSVISIGTSAFESCTSLRTINYAGTRTEWYAIDKDYFWDEGARDHTVYCTDGNI